MERFFKTQNNKEIHLDLSNQILSLEIDDSTLDYDFRNLPEEMVKRTSSGISDLEIFNIQGDTTFEDHLLPSLKEYHRDIKFTSLSLFALKAKQVDDRIYSTVEKLLQDGFAGFQGKYNILKKLVSCLTERLSQNPTDTVIQSLAFIRTASELGGAEYDNMVKSQHLKKAILHSRKFKRKFLEDEFLSKPIGFYSQNDDLRAIFLQDRFLQIKKPDAVKELAKAISGNQELLGNYKNLCQFVQRLSNPFVNDTLLTPSDKSSFIPASRAHETDLVKRLFGLSPIPDGFDLMDEMIKQIRQGTLSLNPREDSGWYDHQTYALEPFLLPDQYPEGEKLQWGPKYRDYLEDIFKAILAATRETHVKQLESMAGGCAAMPIIIEPNLSIEPLPEYYLRRAHSYQFIRTVLTDFFGQDLVYETGLLTEILNMENLFLGAHTISCEEIGLTSKESKLSEREKLMAVGFTRDWLKKIKDDKDISGDIRAMVPLFYDLGRKKIKVLTILGFSTVPVTIKYVQRPEVQLFQNGKQIEAHNLRWESQESTIIKLETAELYVDKLQNREEFRDLCDRHKTKTAILEAIEAR